MINNWAVVVPSFNHADDTITCVGALWNADPRPGQVLLVDDASTEDAVARIAEWAAVVDQLELRSKNSEGARRRLHALNARAYRRQRHRNRGLFAR